MTDTKLNCLIVDDEEVAREVMASYISKVPYLELKASCENAIDAHEIMTQEEIDLVFLDIEMPGLSGIDFLKTVAHKPHVIICSANKDYAVEGFDLDVEDFILKPVTFERFLKAVGKIRSEEKPIELNEDYFYVNQNKRMVRIDMSNIIYIESLRDYVRIVTTQKKVITHQHLSDFESKLPSDRFMRIHRSIIVAIDKIQSFTSSLIDVGEKELPVGRNYKEDVQNKLNRLI
ncbi:Transcriptional regulatory protein YpdB [Salinivirga cyanobacteriivorans]|uniref:Transcriptional regulatory protein YpdB n=1 Tax=Salinivirga cyanobacteriivorans TaxID=1307839 RepID=A0A0S2HZP8_9BACT|nr:LytTR family DNA-binding domain-containing protein [Salinivirga cyanobacteriivorans]ALO15544.1 Transcriptional regulatory protein YpdB [Salinivirga cyanobacteriivorans]